MKKILQIVAILGLISSPLMADKFNYAVVNFEQVFQSSVAFQSLQKQADAMSKKLEAELEKERVALQKLEESIRGQQDSLSKVDFEQKVADFQKKAEAFQTKFRDQKSAFDRNSAEAAKTIQNAMTKIVAEIAQQKKYNMVFPTQAVAYFEPTTEITAEVKSRLDKTLSKVTLKPVK